MSMITFAPPPSGPDVPPHIGPGARVRFVGAVLVALLIAVPACTASTGDDDESGLSADLGIRVGEFLDQNDEHGKVRAVLVYEGDAPVLELYRGEDAKGYLDLRSVTKSVVATLIGIAIDDGLISGVDATLGDLLPAHADIMNAEVAAITLDRILSHTAGFPAQDESDFSTAPDTVSAIITDRVARGPGDGSFEYSNAGSHLLSAILDEATDGRVMDFARSELFDPLGIDSDPAWIETDEGTAEERAAIGEAYLAADFAWPVDPQGIHAGWSFMKLRPSDLLNLGLLYLHRGEREGDSIVSADWVDQATATHVDTFSTPSGYGYQWWTDDGVAGEAMFLALGYGGNLVAVIPDRDLVVVVASEYDVTDSLANAQKFDESQAITMLQYVILTKPD